MKPKRRKREHADTAAIEIDWYIIRGRRQPMPIAVTHTLTQPVDDGMLSCCKLWACDFSPSISVMPGWNDVKKWTKDSKHYTWIFNFFLSSLPAFHSILFFSVRFLRFCHVKWMRLKICVSSVALAQNNTYRWNIIWMKSDFVHVQANRETDGEMAKSIFMRWTPINFWMRAYWLWLERRTC